LFRGGRLTLLRSTLCSLPIYWVNWNEVCCPKHQGGLGIRPLRVMNEALRPNGCGVLQRRMMLFVNIWSKAKYGIDELGWWSKRVLILTVLVGGNLS